MTDIKMLPCPFCGGKASMRHNYHWWVECVSCGADTPDSAPMDEDGAAAAWNARANVAHATAAKDAEIEALRAEREVIGAEAVKYAGKSGRLEAKVEALRAEVAAVWNAMPSGTRYLDPPDGGDVPLHEQVRRMAADAARAERLTEALREAQPFIGWVGSYEELHKKIDAALRDHDKEGKDG